MQHINFQEQDNSYKLKYPSTCPNIIVNVNLSCIGNSKYEDAVMVLNH